MGGTGSNRWGDHSRQTWAEEVWLEIRMGPTVTPLLWRPRSAFRLRFPDHGLALEVGPTEAPEEGAGGTNVVAVRKATLTSLDLNRPRTSLLVVEARLKVARTRWYYQCPKCFRLACVLYLPQQQSTPACRTCHGLAYMTAWLGKDSSGDLRDFREQLRLSKEPTRKKPKELSSRRRWG